MLSILSLIYSKKKNGVYVRHYTNADIKALQNRAKKNNYEPYDIDTSTTYLYIIRETGSIATKAYVDGRNTSYGKNKYYDSNVGIESYLVNLGYSKIEEDMNNIKSNYVSYMQAIADSIKAIL